MRKVVIAGAAVAALAVAVPTAAVLAAPAVWAQGPGRVIRPGIDPLLPLAPGSEIGASVRELRNEEAAASREGVFVEEVRADSPASRAGLRTGDIVVEFDGERVRSVRQFTRLVRETPPGRAVKATVVRGGSRQALDITPQESRRASIVLPDVEREIERGMRALPRDFDFDFDFDLPAGPGARRRLGVTLVPLSDQLAAYFGAREGVLVSAVEADSPAAQAGVRAGDVITAAGGRAVRSPSDVTAAIRDASEGTALEIRLLREKKELTVKATIPDRRPAPSRNRVPV